MIHRPGILLRKSSSELHGGDGPNAHLILTLEDRGDQLNSEGLGWTGVKTVCLPKLQLETVIDLKCSSTYWLYQNKGWVESGAGNQESDCVG